MRITTRVETKGGHDHVTVWAEGENLGTLVIDAGRGAKLARLLDQEHDTESGRAAVRQSLLRQVRFGEATEVVAAEILLAQPDLSAADRAAVLQRLQTAARRDNAAARLYLAQTTPPQPASHSRPSALERINHLAEVRNLCLNMGWPEPAGLMNAFGEAQAEFMAECGAPHVAPGRRVRLLPIQQRMVGAMQVGGLYAVEAGPGAGKTEGVAEIVRRAKAISGASLFVMSADRHAADDLQRRLSIPWPSVGQPTDRAGGVDLCITCFDPRGGSMEDWLEHRSWWGIIIHDAHLLPTGGSASIVQAALQRARLLVGDRPPFMFVVGRPSESRPWAQEVIDAGGTLITGSAADNPSLPPDYVERIEQS